MPWYYRILSGIDAAAPFLAPTQAINLALLTGAILKKQTLCRSELARAYPTPQQRRVAAPKHDLLHRLKRLWRFTDNERVDALETQAAFVPHLVGRLGFPRLLELSIDWTFFDTTLHSGERVHYQVLSIAVPRRGRALPLLHLAYDRDALPAGKSQNQLEQDALLAVVRALPWGVRPVVLADRGFGRAGFLCWLRRHQIDYVVRLKKGGCVTPRLAGGSGSSARKGFNAGNCVGREGCVTGSTTGAPETFSSTWRFAGGYPRAGRETPGASARRSRGTWPRA